MSDGTLTIEHGEVRLNNRIVPGILKSLDVRGSVMFDKAEKDSQSGKVKTPLGWEDADVSLVMQLVSDNHLKPTKPPSTLSCYEKLAELNGIFRDTDKSKDPKVYEVVNAHITARGIERVVFSGLNSSETNENDIMLATLSFVEHLPVIIRKENQVASSDKALGESPDKQQKEPEKDSEIMKDPFTSGLELGIG